MLRPFAALAFAAALAPAQQPAPRQIKDPVTGRSITWFQSPHHETHHYYDIPAWSPAGDKILFFRMDADVDKLTALGRYPGSVWIMNADGTGARKMSETVQGNYHVGAGQFWGPDGSTVYLSGRGPDGRATQVVDIATGKARTITTPVTANRMSPDFKVISCVRASEWGLYDVASDKYTQLVTLERALALSPNKQLAVGTTTALQNTRFSPDGKQIIIVHRSNEDFPRLVELFIYDIESKQLRFGAADLHHPGWRPDGKAVMFVRRRVFDNHQALWSVDLRTGAETRLTEDHVPAGHPSYHPRKPHLIVTDCYGGPMGQGLAIIDTRTRKMTQLVTIPIGSKPAPQGDERFPFRNWGLWFPPRPYLNEPRPVWNHDGSKLLFTSQESGRINLYVADTSDL